MKENTRKALALPLDATDADAAAALDAGKHMLTMRDLERTDPEFLLYLKKEKFETYSRLYESYYGQPPTGAKKPNAAAKPTPTQSQKEQPDAAKSGAKKPTLRELEKTNPKEVLRLKHEEPTEYARLFQQQYGSAPADHTPNGRPAAPAPAPAATYRPTGPTVMRAVAPESAVAQRLQAEGETACPLPLLGQVADRPDYQAMSWN